MLEEAPDEDACEDEEEDPVTPVKTVGFVARAQVRKIPELIAAREEVDDVVIRIEAESTPLRWVQLEPARDDVDAGARLVQLMQDGEEQPHYEECIREGRDRLRSGTWILSCVQGQDVEKMKFGELLRLVRGDRTDGSLSTSLELIFRRSDPRGSGVAIFKNFTNVGGTISSDESDDEDDDDSDDEGFDHDGSSLERIQKTRMEYDESERPETPPPPSTQAATTPSSLLFQALGTSQTPSTRPSQTPSPDQHSPLSSTKGRNINYMSSTKTLANEAVFFERRPSPQSFFTEDCPEDDVSIVESISEKRQEEFDNHKARSRIARLERRLIKLEFRVRATECCRDAAIRDYASERKHRLTAESELEQLRLNSAAQLDTAQKAVTEANKALNEERMRAMTAIRGESELLAKSNATASQLDSARRDLVQNIAKWRKAEARATSAEKAVRAIRKESTDYQRMLLDAVREPCKTESPVFSSSTKPKPSFTSVFSSVLGYTECKSNQQQEKEPKDKEWDQAKTDNEPSTPTITTTTATPDEKKLKPSPIPPKINTENTPKSASKLGASFLISHRTPSPSTKHKKTQREIELEALCNRLSLANADRDEEIDTLRAVLAEEHVLTQRAFGVSRSSRRSRTVAPRASKPLAASPPALSKVAELL